jgi:hypothetical protein
MPVSLAELSPDCTPTLFASLQLLASKAGHNASNPPTRMVNYRSYPTFQRSQLVAVEVDLVDVELLELGSDAVEDGPGSVGLGLAALQLALSIAFANIVLSHPPLVQVRDAYELMFLWPLR